MIDDLDDFGEAHDPRVADLLARARTAGTADELIAESQIVHQMQRIAAAPAAVADLDARRSTRLVTKRAARAAIVVGVLVVGTSTAAATGTLPDAAQSAVARATSPFGLDLHDPRPAGTDTVPGTDTSMLEPTDSAPPSTPATQTVDGTPKTVTTRTAAPSTSNAAAVPANAPTSIQNVTTSDRPSDRADHPLDAAAAKGLCTAWAAKDEDNPSKQRSEAMERLQDAAAAAGMTVEQYCAGLEPSTGEPPASDAPKPKPDKPEKPDKPGKPDKPKPDEPGKPDKEN